tara:strand:- start:38 stop:1177 length:1140 start_codon:yes stop_codon:yes gene_type:complete
MTYLYEPSVFSRSSLVVEDAYTYTPSDGDTVTLDLNNGSYQRIVPSGAVSSITISDTITGASDYAGAELTLDVEQPTTGTMSVDWGTGIVWSEDNEPSLTETSRAIDQVSMRVVKRVNSDGSFSNALVGNDRSVSIAATPSAFSNDYSMELVQASSQYCALSSSGALDRNHTDPFSLSLWVRPTAALTGTLPLVTKMSGAPALAGYALYYYGGDLYMQFRADQATNNQIYWSISGTSTPVDSWTHVVMVYESTTVAKIYINGTDETPGSSGGGGLSATLSNAGTFKVGAFDALSDFVDVMIDEVSFWEKALSSSEVTDVYNSGTPADLTGSSDLVSWWRFGDDASDDFTGTTGQITDQVGPNDLIPYNTTSANKAADVP